jgi:predicted nucleic acid-binding protein
VSSELAATEPELLVLDANILVRAVLGRRVLSLLEAYAGRVSFLTPETAFASVRAHLPEILIKRGLSPEAAAHLLEEEILGRLPRLVAPVRPELYADLKVTARRRLAGRDESDWPSVALALRLNCPIWTEDQDFFGSGVATWTTDRVGIYLESDPWPVDAGAAYIPKGPPRVEAAWSQARRRGTRGLRLAVTIGCCGARHAATSGEAGRRT